MWERLSSESKTSGALSETDTNALAACKGFEKQEIVPAVEPNPWTLLQLAYLLYLTGERNFP